MKCREPPSGALPERRDSKSNQSIMLSPPCEGQSRGILECDVGGVKGAECRFQAGSLREIIGLIIEIAVGGG